MLPPLHVPGCQFDEYERPIFDWDDWYGLDGKMYVLHYEWHGNGAGQLVWQQDKIWPNIGK